MSLERGKTYHWAEILDELDAEDRPPRYALHRDGRVVGFALNRWQNPKAPNEVLVGYGEGRERFAEMFIPEKPVIPVLIKEKESDDVWCCAGRFKFQRVSDAPADKNRRVKPHDIPAIYKIIILTEETNQP